MARGFVWNLAELSNMPKKGRFGTSKLEEVQIYVTYDMFWPVIQYDMKLVYKL